MLMLYEYTCIVFKKLVFYQNVRAKRKMTLNVGNNDESIIITQVKRNCMKYYNVL